MKSKHKKTLHSLLAHPVSANIKWSDIESLLKSLGAEIEERAGSRIAVFLFNEVQIFHRPHPSPNTDKGAVVTVRDWLKRNGVTL